MESKEQKACDMTFKNVKTGTMTGWVYLETAMKVPPIPSVRRGGMEMMYTCVSPPAGELTLQGARTILA